MSLIKLASESGVGVRAMQVLADESCKGDVDAAINWRLVVDKLQELINALPIQERRGIIVSFDDE